MDALAQLNEALRALTTAEAGHELDAVREALACHEPSMFTRECGEALLELARMRAAERDAFLRASERAQMLSEASFEGIMIHENGSIIDANQRLADMLGYEPSEVLGEHTLPRCVAPEDQAFVLQRMRDRVEGEYVITGIRKDGSRFRAEILSKQGKLGVRPVRVAAVRDVTERERAAAQLKESETRLQELAEAAFDLLGFSRQGVIVELAGPVEALTGYSKKALLGRSVLDFVAPPEHELTRRQMSTNGSVRYASTVVRSTGETVPVEIVAVLTTVDGIPTRLAGLRDLTETHRMEQGRRELEQQLERSQRLDSLGVLAGGIAHDFNNLLVGIVGNADLLLSGRLAEDQRECVQGILQAGNRAATLTAQLLTYAGRREFGQREPIDLGELLPELRTLLGAALSKKAALELSIAPGSAISGNRATILQVLMNLLTNASDALAGAVGTIQVCTKRVAEPDARFAQALGASLADGAGPWILIEVTDSGIGMDEATKSRVFEPFFTTKSKGHGLGLAATLGIVSSHGGAISVQSAPGRGSTFAILLPASEEAKAPVTSVRAVATRGGRVLIVDDEELVRKQVRRMLEAHGYAVLEARDGKSALQLLEREQVDLVFLDVTMPDLDGTEVVRTLRSRGSSVPIVLSSGYADFELDARVDAGAIQGFLPKPFKIADLLGCVEKAILR
ncbi:MAG TPA: PAS domain S-box protein [Polyangiaceae bacterium]|jgi:PAS domain S-box-containing protein